MSINSNLKLESFGYFVESMVETIVLEEKSFDSYKEELKKLCEKEGVDYVDLECDLRNFLRT